jgi:hypothetical protein
MHPQIARQLIAQRNADLAAMARRPARLNAGQARRLALPRLAVPVWRVSWSRVAAPAGGDRSWLIVISARRTHLGV